jgi:hypothetical protein
VSGTPAEGGDRHSLPLSKDRKRQLFFPDSLACPVSESGRSKPFTDRRTCLIVMSLIDLVGSFPVSHGGMQPQRDRTLPCDVQSRLSSALADLDADRETDRGPGIKM